MQNTALRLALCAYKTSPITSLHNEAGLKPLPLFREIKILNYYLRLNANEDQTMSERISRVDVEKYKRNKKLSRPYILRVGELAQKYNIDIGHIALL